MDLHFGPGIREILSPDDLEGAHDGRQSFRLESYMLLGAGDLVINRILASDPYSGAHGNSVLT